MYFLIFLLLLLAEWKCVKTRNWQLVVVTSTFHTWLHTFLNSLNYCYIHWNPIKWKISLFLSTVKQLIYTKTVFSRRINCSKPALRNSTSSQKDCYCCMILLMMILHIVQWKTNVPWYEIIRKKNESRKLTDRSHWSKKWFTIQLKQIEIIQFLNWSKYDVTKDQ